MAYLPLWAMAKKLNFNFMKILKIFNDENVSQDNTDLFEKRRSVRGIVIDSENKIALLYSNKFKYYVLPGGGVEEGESIDQAIIRECKEEIGCDVEITGEVGKTIEVREKDNLTNEAHCYVLKLIGEKQKPEFMGDEIEDDFITMWVSVEKAIKHIESEGHYNDLYHEYMKQRSLVFLKEFNH